MSDIDRPECRSRVNQRVITNSDVQLVQDARTKYPPRRPPSIQYSWATFLWQQLLTALPQGGENGTRSFGRESAVEPSTGASDGKGPRPNQKIL
jgi:hypothetical protein